MMGGKPFHVFLSHNSSDKPAVEELAQRLRTAGLEPWLDKWNLVPGDAWQPALEGALRDSATCVVFVGPSGLGAWQHEEMRAAISRRVASQQKEERFRVIPVLLPGAVRGDRSQLPDFLTATTWVEFRRTLDEEITFRILERAIRGLPPGPGQSVTVTDCPYRGLEFFDVQHASLFFGRAAVTDWLLSALRGTLSAQGPTRFLAIIGASGSGKSSLARAGLLAALKNGGIEGSANWLTTICRPGPSPLESLADELAKTKGLNFGSALPANVIKQLKKDLQEDNATLHLTTRASLGDAQSARRLVVLVDQFEELFTVCRDDAERQAFIGNLLYAARVAQGQTIILLTMRADFYGKCASHPELAAAISEHQFLVGPLTADELREAIERPAQLAGCEFEPGLVELLVDDVQRQPGALPLLQYGLLRMWNTRTGRRITTADYRAVGQLEGIIEKRAEEVFNGFDDSQKELCRRLFMRLSQPGEGTEDTKRRAPWHELASLHVEARSVEEVVKHLADERLITTGGSAMPTADSVVEVAHETLIRRWKRLREWIEADRAGLRTHRRLTEATEEWAKSHADRSLRDSTLLFDGTRLALANEWAEKHANELNDLEREFLSTSQQLQEQERLEVERQRQRELETAQRLAEEEKLRRLAEHERAENFELLAETRRASARRQKRLSWALGVVALIAGCSALVSILQYWRADTEHKQLEASVRKFALSQVEILLGAEPASVPSQLKNLMPFRDAILPRLRELAQKTDLTTKQRVRISLALLPDDPSQADFLKQQLLEASPAELAMIRDGLSPVRTSLLGEFWGIVENRAAEPVKRLRAAYALASYDANNPRWEAVRADVIVAIVAKNPQLLSDWLDVVKQLLEPLPADRMVELILDADVREVGVLMPVFKSRAETIMPRLTEVFAGKSVKAQSPTNKPVRPSPNARAIDAIETGHGLVADEFALVQTMALSDFVQTAEDLRGSGYRPIRFRPYRVDDHVLVAAAWNRDERDWQMEFDLTVDRASERVREWKEQSYLPADVAGYVMIDSKGEPANRYAVIVIRSTAEDDDAEIHIGQTFDADIDTEQRMAFEKKDYGKWTQHWFPDAVGIARYSCIYRNRSVKTGWFSPLRGNEQAFEIGLTPNDLVREICVGRASEPPTELNPYEKMIQGLRAPRERPFANGMRLFGEGRYQEAIPELSAWIEKIEAFGIQQSLRAVAYARVGNLRFCSYGYQKWQRIHNEGPYVAGWR